MPLADDDGEEYKLVINYGLEGVTGRKIMNSRSFGSVVNMKRRKDHSLSHAIPNIEDFLSAMFIMFTHHTPRARDSVYLEWYDK